MDGRTAWKVKRMNGQGNVGGAGNRQKRGRGRRRKRRAGIEHPLTDAGGGHYPLGAEGLDRHQAGRWRHRGRKWTSHRGHRCHHRAIAAHMLAAGHRRGMRPSDRRIRTGHHGLSAGRRIRRSTDAADTDKRNRRRRQQRLRQHQEGTQQPECLWETSGHHSVIVPAFPPKRSQGTPSLCLRIEFGRVTEQFLDQLIDHGGRKTLVIGRPCCIILLQATRESDRLISPLFA